MVFLMVEVFNCLWFMEDMDICLLRPSTLSLSIASFFIFVMVVEVDLGIKITATIYLEILEFIILVLMVEVELGLKRPATLPLVIVEQELMLTGEVDIGLNPDTLPCAYQEVAST